IDMQEAADAVLKSLVYENANNDCIKALDFIKTQADVNLTDYLKACANISFKQFKAELFATAIAQQLQVARAAIKCLECKEQGHIRKQCPKGKKGIKKPSKPCPRCQKGIDWSNQCRSKYDKESNPLPKQGNQKAG
ncbi:GAK10 protein, partial [Pomatostomus ruficeps]|nr:GAK10 protein [Pomatostomus ruficeps]